MCKPPPFRSLRLKLEHTSGGGLAGVDVADDHDVDMSLLLTEETVSIV